MKIFKIFIILLIVAFLGLYISYSSGYYTKLKGAEVILTNQKIEEFESDVKNGKDILLENYQEPETDYSNKTTKMSLKISTKASNMVDKFIKFLFNKLGSALE